MVRGEFAGLFVPALSVYRRGVELFLTACIDLLLLLLREIYIAPTVWCKALNNAY